jgi:hypothetical protein
MMPGDGKAPSPTAHSVRRRPEEFRTDGTVENTGDMQAGPAGFHV